MIIRLNFSITYIDKISICAGLRFTKRLVFGFKIKHLFLGEITLLLGLFTGFIVPIFELEIISRINLKCFSTRDGDVKLHILLCCDCIDLNMLF